MSKISNMTWDQAFNEYNREAQRHTLTIKITNELFPREDGEEWINWIGLSEPKRAKVWLEYSKCYKTHNKYDKGWII